MSKIAIVYGSSTGATEAVAARLKDVIGDADVYNVDGLNFDELQPYSFLILGASTTGVGDLQDDWDMVLPKFLKLDFTGKKVAIFGLGDSASFSDSFASAIGHLYNGLKGKVEIVGSVSVDGYTYDDSDAVIDDRFVGLALDEDNEYAETDARIAAWVEDLKQYF